MRSSTPGLAHLDLHVITLLQQFLSIQLQLLQPLGVASTQTLEEKQVVIMVVTINYCACVQYLKVASQLVPLFAHFLVHLQDTVVQFELRLSPPGSRATINCTHRHTRTQQTHTIDTHTHTHHTAHTQTHRHIWKEHNRQ